MKEFFYIAHVLVSSAVVGLVLLQHGKGADAGAAFGAGASSTVFGSQGSGNFLSRSTAILATVFFLSSMFLAYLSAQAAKGPESIMQDSVTTQIPIESPALDLPPIVPPAPQKSDLPPVAPVTGDAPPANSAPEAAGSEAPVVQEPAVDVPPSEPSGESSSEAAKVPQ